jgi:hypothetical protein
MLWIGSDVSFHAPSASDAVISRAWHWCVAPWLQEELAELSIAADTVRLTPPPFPDPVPDLPEVFTVLAYTPEDRCDLYGREFVLTLARRCPGVRFMLLAAVSDESLPANVTSLGQRDDIGAVLSDTTLYLRPTAHDGLSNLVLEALSYGRYVLWTYPFVGADVVQTVDVAEARLKELYRQHEEGCLPLNHEGSRGVLEMFEPESMRTELLQRLQRITQQRWRQPPRGPRRLATLASLRLLQRTLRADRTWDGGGAMTTESRHQS